jgi:hypothetical protein
MMLRFRIGRWRFSLNIVHVTDVAGVNSILPDGKHILMWDFDDASLAQVKANLAEVALRYKLPNIYILNSGLPNHYMAYCLKRVTWQKAVEILAATKGICVTYLRFGVFRGKFTLRITPKDGRRIRLVCILKSPWPEDVKIEEIGSFVKYETLSDWYRKMMPKMPILKLREDPCLKRLSKN